jgi:hypothetical protein
LSVYGTLFSAMAHKWYGDSLIKQNNRLDGLWHYEGVLRLYKKMGNEYQTRKREVLLSLFE